MTESKKSVDELVATIAPKQESGPSSTRRNASLVLAALAAICCFNISHANAQQQRQTQPASQQSPLDTDLTA